MKYKTFFWLALRFLGILLALQAAPRLLAPLFEAMLLGARVWSTSWPYQVSGMMPYAIQFVIGLYLIVGGRWVVNWLIPSNRPYCPECGYELTGLPDEGHCPECGTFYRRRSAPRDASVPPPGPAT